MTRPQLAYNPTIKHPLPYRSGTGLNTCTFLAYPITKIAFSTDFPNSDRDTSILNTDKCRGSGGRLWVFLVWVQLVRDCLGVGGVGVAGVEGGKVGGVWVQLCGRVRSGNSGCGSVELRFRAW
ncbi:hypothetical protein Pmani_015732 [Petrolisthes manimaculis]|uniref:Uncharacterized protein n=1 Tax=Petrolisthes manimaculis TaxID=1843537 RepID=A0AAE1PT69_9EUCA|nr:hypothetical protein Pmani_015732 [Petrolisthes manimaculis]